MFLRERAGRERGAAKSSKERGITDEIGGGEGGQDWGQSLRRKDSITLEWESCRVQRKSKTSC